MIQIAVEVGVNKYVNRFIYSIKIYNCTKLLFNAKI